jgi:Tol biopolymer transport system component
MIARRLLLLSALVLNLATLHGAAHPQTSASIIGWEPKTLVFEVVREISVGSPLPADTDIFIVDPLGSKPRRLVTGETPALSPDGKQVAYCVRKGNGFGQIQIINTDGSGRRELTNVKGRACEPQWSPDGEKIAFTVYNDKSDTNYDKSGTIYIADKNGDNAIGIVEGIAARWSPDGARIIFFRDPENHASKGSIWIANPDGTGARKIVNDSNAVATSWYPDGKSIAFASERDHKSAIFRVNLDGTNLEEIARAEKLDLFFPVFSPDGQQLIVDAKDGSDRGRAILFLNLTSNESKILAHGLHPSVLWIKK